MLRGKKKRGGVKKKTTCIQRWEEKGSAWAAAVQRDLLWAMTFPLSSSSLLESLWGCWAGSGGVPDMGARCISAHPAPLPKPLSEKPQLQLKHLQTEALCALPPPHLCHEQGAGCRCLGYSSHGAWQCSWGRQHVGFGVQPSSSRLGHYCGSALCLSY